MMKISLNEIIAGEDARLKASDNPYLETGFMGSALALFYLYKITKDNKLLNIAEDHLEMMRHTLKNKISLEINNGLSGIGLGITWLVEEKFISGDLNVILKEIDDMIYRYCVESISEYNPKYESTYLDMLIYIAVRINYLKRECADYPIFLRLAQMLYDHIYFNISMVFLIEPRPSNIRYKLFLFVLASWLLYRNGDSYIKRRVANVFNEIYDIIVTIHPFCAVNRFMLHIAINHILPCFNDNIEQWKEYSVSLVNDSFIDQMLDETLDNDMSVFHGIPYIYLLLKCSNINIPYNVLNVIKNRIEDALALYSNYEDCKKWDYIGLSGIMGTVVILEDIKLRLSHV